MNKKALQIVEAAGLTEDEIFNSPVFAAGYDNGYNDGGQAHNPYAGGTLDWALWTMGCHDGFQDC